MGPLNCWQHDMTSPPAKPDERLERIAASLGISDALLASLIVLAETREA